MKHDKLPQKNCSFTAVGFVCFFSRFASLECNLKKKFKKTNKGDKHIFTNKKAINKQTGYYTHLIYVTCKTTTKLHVLINISFLVMKYNHNGMV